jgi:hypothetical protein
VGSPGGEVRRYIGIRGEAERALAALGCPKVNLQVLSANAAARSCWREVGYAPDDVVSLGKRLR